MKSGFVFCLLNGARGAAGMEGSWRAHNFDLAFRVINAGGVFQTDDPANVAGVVPDHFGSLEGILGTTDTVAGVISLES